MSELPVRRDIQRAIDAALHPKGMSVHSGKAVVGADKLAYMLKAYDALAADRDRLAKELAEAQPDAERYRWLMRFYLDDIRRLTAGNREGDVIKISVASASDNETDGAEIKSCVHCASERISQLSFDVWECEDCGREFTFDWRPAESESGGRS